MITDEEVIKNIVNGNIEKFGIIIERYEKRLRGFIYKLIGNSVELDDLVEDTLISAYQNLKGFNQDQKFSSWILRIAHNKTVDFIKKKKPILIGDELNDINSESKLIEDVEINNLLREELFSAIDKLELKYKEAIILYYFEEKSYEEISDILHITINNVGQILSRGKQKLKKILKTFYNEK